MRLRASQLYGPLRRRTGGIAIAEEAPESSSGRTCGNNAPHWPDLYLAKDRKWPTSKNAFLETMGGLQNAQGRHISGH